MELYAWLTELSSASPAPGGGGASALVGAVASSLGSMVANLTTGNMIYACYQADIERILAQTADLTARLHGLIAADAEAFVPLSAAYGIPKDDPTRAERLESALRVAAKPPMDMLETFAELLPILEELTEKGSRLAISDVGCAATFCQSAARGALLNLFVNTKLMADREYAYEQNKRAIALEGDINYRTEAVFKTVKESMI